MSDQTKKGNVMPVCWKLLRPAALVAALLVTGLGTDEARAQGGVGGGYSSSYRVSDYLGAPGLYGMSYGFASYGMPQTYTVFSAYPGPSYGSNFPPYGILPGRYGVGLWRPGFAAPGYVYGASYYQPWNSDAYRTFAVGSPYGAPVNRIASPPPVGVYAPALGPRTLYGW
jgi:hypothetical protein